MKTSLVKWREWGKESFEEAKASDKPLLLSISATWCHWCHVMDDTSYSDEEIAGIINESFVPVRVDTDRMPDVNERYNMGGWPTTAILTYTGEVLMGATYVPPDKLKETLTSLVGFYAENRDAILEKASELRKKKEAEFREALKASPGELSDDIIAELLEELERNYDPLHGGFAWGPKFPIPEGIQLLFTAYHDTGNKAYLDMAEKSLHGMSAYGMYDHEMGGFFRYAVTRDWSEPHYEKMTESNAGLLVNLVDAYRITGKREYIDTITKTVGYINDWLWAKPGYFCGSQDADEEYYSHPLKARKKMKAPFVDTTMYTNLNAKMAVAYLTVWELTGDDNLRQKAMSALGFVLGNMKGDGGGLYHFHDGKPNRFGLFTDQAAMVKALLFAFQLTGERPLLDEARALVEFMEKSHWDPENGGFFDLPEDKDAVAALANRAKPLADNSEMAMALKTLFVITGDARYEDMARKCLLVHTRGYGDFGYMASVYALAVDFFIKPVLELTVVGETSGPDMAALLKPVNETFIPRRVLRIMDAGADRHEIKKKGYSLSGCAEVYICRESVCTSKIIDPDTLKKELVAHAA